MTGRRRGKTHLLFGLAGSGKSTLARELADGRGAVRFTLDEWMLRLFPHLGYEEAAYGVAADRVREVVWTVAEQVLGQGIDVVLDWNSWSRDRRAWAVQRAAACNSEVVVHVLPSTLAQSNQRLAAREVTKPPWTHAVTAEGNAHLATLMQAPEPTEGLEICWH